MASMDTAEDASRVVIPSTASSSSSLFLHPLVIINISDHHTRTKVHTRNTDPLIVGLLYGTQSGRTTELLNSLELVAQTDAASGAIVIDEEYMQQKMQQFKEVFKTLDPVGWYATHTGTPTTAHLHVHRQLYRENEGVVFLQLDTHPDPQSTELPVALYEACLDAQQRVMMSACEYQLATEEAERIGVSLIAHHSTGPATGAQSASGAQSIASGAQSASGEEGVSQLRMQVSEQANAVVMLTRRIDVVKRYLLAVKSGEVEKDAGLLRSVWRLCSRLPAGDTLHLDHHLAQERNDVMMTAYLAHVTKTCNIVAEAMDKFAATHDKMGKGKQRFV